MAEKDSRIKELEGVIKSMGKVRYVSWISSSTLANSARLPYHSKAGGCGGMDVDRKEDKLT